MSNCSILAYIIAISLQLSGALLLLLYAFPTKRDDLIKSFAKSSVIFRDNNTDKIFYNTQAFTDMCKNAYLNKFAFIYILAGYVVGIFGEIGAVNKAMVMLYVLALFVIELCLARFIVRAICKCSKKVNQEITNDELLKLNIEPDIENISMKEIDKLDEKMGSQGDDNA